MVLGFGFFDWYLCDGSFWFRMGKLAVVTVLAVPFFKCFAGWLVPILTFVTLFTLSLDKVKTRLAI